MKHVVFLVLAFLIAITAVGASTNFYEDMSDVQRYDLADAYDQVAERFEELDDAPRAEKFRAMAELIFPGFYQTERPAEIVDAVAPAPPEERLEAIIALEASVYYFEKLLRGVFSENLTLSLSVIADTLFLPLYDEGIKKSNLEEEMEFLFAKYEIDSYEAGDVLQLEDIEVMPLENGYWRVDVETWPQFTIGPEGVTFWSDKMGFYFRKFPQGWRLAAIGPVA